MPRFLNIACGTSYVRSADWENLDYVSRDPLVRTSNILHNLKASQPKYDAIYCSHFLEHIPQEKVGPFLQRCKELMKDDAVFRIVVPDAEFLVREYLKHKDSARRLHADFAFANFLDQCVRQKSGGRLAEYFERIASGELKELGDYAEYLNGHLEFASTSRSTASLPSRIVRKVETFYIRSICALLPKAFREQNISFSGVGEKHHWMYDFDSLKFALSQAGFTRIERHSFNTSGYGENIFAPLDENAGRPRKGHHQLFVEAWL